MGRKEEILRLIEEGCNTAKELAYHFNVSLMTIYRDLKELEEEGRIVRRHGNIQIRKEEDLKDTQCAICGKDVDLRLAFIYILKGGKKVHTCCAHCGLIAYRNMDKDRVDMVITRDFINSNPVNAYSAVYVVGAEASPCCTPSAFVFADKASAEKFSKGFGGYIAEFEEATDRMEELMKRAQSVRLNL